MSDPNSKTSTDVLANLRGLLANILYMGKVRYKDEVHPGEHKAIVEESVWQRANQMLQGNGRTGGMHIRNKYGALLKGLLHCKPCQTPGGTTTRQGFQSPA